MRKAAPYIFIFLCTCFLMFSLHIYLQPLIGGNIQKQGEMARVAEGRLVWQKYNCQSCHQLYSLGGYLGPDLTNIISAPGKGAVYIHAMVVSGTSQMPAFPITDSEFTNLISYLESTDAYGIASPANFRSLPNGMIEPK